MSGGSSRRALNQGFLATAIAARQLGEAVDGVEQMVAGGWDSMGYSGSGRQNKLRTPFYYAWGLYSVL
jgi:hypothetical protein